MPIHDWTRVRAGVFHDFHQDWTICIKRTLNSGVLPDGYYAMVEQASDAPPRVAFTASAEPDVYAEKSNRIVVFNGAHEVVAVIEVVSRGNKSSRQAFQGFVNKAIDFLRGGIHVLVVDLHPATSRDPEGIHAAIWSEMTDCDFHLPKGKPFTLASYSAGTTQRAFVEAVGIGDELPSMPLFLEPEVYVQVPLETTYQIAFDDLPKPWRGELTLDTNH